MGQEIVYCAKCAIRLLAPDFEKGKAFKIGAVSYCVACSKTVLDAMPESERRAFLAGARDPRRTSSPELTAPASPSSSDLPSATPRRGSGLPTETPRGGTHLTTDSSTRIKTTVRRLVPSPNRGRLYIWWVGAIAAILVMIAAVLSRPAPHRPRSGPSPSADPSPPLPSPPAPPPPADPRRVSAEKALREARDFARASPENLSGQLERFRSACREAEGTPLQAEIQMEIDRIRRKIIEGLSAEMVPLEAGAREAAGREEFGKAIALLEAARTRFSFAEWTSLVEERIRKVNEDAWKAYAPLREEALKARRAGADDRVREITTRIGRWGLSPLAEDLARVLVAEPASPPSAAPALVAYRKAWEESLAPLAWRDYGEAVRLLKRLEVPAEEAVRAERASDLEVLEAASALWSEVRRILSSWPAGKPVRLQYQGPGKKEVEGPAIRADAGGIEIHTGAGPVVVPLSEISSGSLVEVYRGRGGARPEEDRRAVVAFLALEGEEEAARAIGEKYAVRARRLILKPASGAECEAARLFWEAEDEFRSVSTRAEALEKYRGLLSGHAETAFVRRNRGLIESRVRDAGDYFFHPHDLFAAGTFLLVPGAKVPFFQLSGSGGAPEGGKDNYVEFSLYAAEAVPRCWIYAGACCAETFTFYTQVTDSVVPHPSKPSEILAAGPGDNASALVKNPLLFLPRLHSMHGGPKQPVRWAWFEIPLPKFPSAGVKKIRILSEQQGFAVAYALVSVVRKAPPDEAEMKKILKAHAAMAPPPSASTPSGTILREYWTNINGPAVEALLKNSRFPDSPTGTSQESALESPVGFGDHYGTRLRGYVHPPQTGYYTFWITGDDQYELWLSPDENPANKKKIAWHDRSKRFREWGDEANMKSAPFPLVAGRRYYVEVLHKEENGEDHVSVGWSLPDGTLERPIPGTRLSPWGHVSQAVPPVPGTGQPRFWRAINLNGPPLVIDGRPWEGMDTSNYTFRGERFEAQDVPLNPPTDDPRARMIRSSIWNRDGSNLTLTNVPKGIYQVYLYVWEDSENGSQTFDVLLNGRVVQSRHRSGDRGRWDRLGPWTVSVADGTLEVRASPADANFSGIEIWRLK